MYHMSKCGIVNTLSSRRSQITHRAWTRWSKDKDALLAA
eukprot:COSAG01_NODE_22530_length_851_cov_2.533245_1_plen_38_part_01